MALEKVDLLTIARRNEAVENALTIMLHAIATALPTVKDDVINNLERHAKSYEGEDDTIVNATRALINRIESLKPIIHN